MKVKFEVVEDDILNQAEWADAIVNCANAMMIHGGGICGTIFEAAGKELDKECKEFRGSKVGDAIITKGYNIPAKIIHAVGPRYDSSSDQNKELLLKTYQNVIKTAEENGIEKIAIPLISSGIYAYPLPLAATTAVEYLQDLESDVVKEVKLVLYTRVYYLLCRELATK